jgi:hypothetical protein
MAMVWPARAAVTASWISRGRRVSWRPGLAEQAHIGRAGLASGSGELDDDRLGAPIRSKPVRITLDLSPELYRQLTQWADSAAVALNVPRVALADAVRAMIRVAADNPGEVLERLRRDRNDSPAGGRHQPGMRGPG